MSRMKEEPEENKKRGRRKEEDDERKMKRTSWGELQVGRVAHRRLCRSGVFPLGRKEKKERKNGKSKNKNKER